MKECRLSAVLVALTSLVLLVDDAGATLRSRLNVNLFENPGFEKSTAMAGATKWLENGVVGGLLYSATDIPVHGGRKAIFFGGYDFDYGSFAGTEAAEVLVQSVLVPNGARSLRFEVFAQVETEEFPCVDASGAYDQLQLSLENPLTGAVVWGPATITNCNASTSGYAQYSFTYGLDGFAGRELRFVARAFLDISSATAFFVDDARVVALSTVASAARAPTMALGEKRRPASARGPTRSLKAQAVSIMRPLLANGGGGGGDANLLRPDVDRVARATAAFKRAATVTDTLDTGEMGAVTGFVGLVPAATFSSAEIGSRRRAVDCVGAYGEALGLASADAARFLSQETTASGSVIVRFQQLHGAVPVEGRHVVLEFSTNGDLVSILSGALPGIGVGTTPTVSGKDAVTLAARELGFAAAEQDVDPTLVVYSPDGRSAFLAWKLSLRAAAEEPSRWVVYVDAATGRVLRHFDNRQTSRNRRTHDATGLGGFYCDSLLGLPGVLKRTETQGPTTDTDVNAAHDNAGRVYDYYLATHGRDSWDGGGAAIISSVHFCYGYNNAFWDGTQMVYGDGDGVVLGPTGRALDIVAHELTHAVIGSTAGLEYFDEPGALNESFADVFGAMVDRNDWKIGEDAMTPGVRNDAMRWMDRPGLGNQPATMAEYTPLSAYIDNAGVHINSGLPNRVFYSLATRITKKKAEAIYYDALAHRLFPLASFAAVRTATIAAAVALFGSAGVEARETNGAWAEHGIGTAGIPPTVTRIVGGSIPSGSSQQIAWSTNGAAAGMQYHVQYTDNYRAGYWKDIVRLTAAGANHATWQVPNKTGKFFRIRVRGYNPANQSFTLFDEGDSIFSVTSSTPG